MQPAEPGHRRPGLGGSTHAMHGTTRRSLQVAAADLQHAGCSPTSRCSTYALATVSAGPQMDQAHYLNCIYTVSRTEALLPQAQLLSEEARVNLTAGS